MTSDQRPETRNKKLLLIDGNNLFHRAYHALPPLNSKDGENSNAVYGFTNMLLKAVSEIKPDFVACAFDTAAPTFRHVEFEKYKAQRPAPPPDLYPQLPKVKKVLDAFGVKYFEKAGYEADDLLATIATKCLQTTDYGLQQKEKTVDSEQITVNNVVILSGDRDVLQLVNGNIKVQMPGWNLSMTTFYGSEEVKEKFGITPLQMIDYKSLIGDASDNVPGVMGIGPKTASSLLSQYGTLENLYAHLDELPVRVKEKLEIGRDLALAAKRLVELDKTVDLGLKIDDLRFNPQWESLRQMLDELGFRSIAAKLPTAQGVVNVSKVSNVPNGQNEEQLEFF